MYGMKIGFVQIPSQACMMHSALPVPSAGEDSRPMQREEKRRQLIWTGISEYISEAPKQRREALTEAGI